MCGPLGSLAYSAGNGVSIVRTSRKRRAGNAPAPTSPTTPITARTKCGSSTAALYWPLPPRRSFRGDADRVDPEEAYVASLSSCHMLTFLAICARKRLTVDAYEDDAVGFLEKGRTGIVGLARRCFRRGCVSRRERMSNAETLDQLHHLSHEECFIANSVKTEITVEPRVKLLTQVPWRLQSLASAPNSDHEQSNCSPHFRTAYERVTNGIRVAVKPAFLDDQSEPDEGKYLWSYTSISRTAAGNGAAVSRYWHITDAAGRVQEVRGPGVVGAQPVLAPGAEFRIHQRLPAADGLRHDGRALSDEADRGRGSSRPKSRPSCLKARTSVARFINPIS